MKNSEAFKKSKWIWSRTDFQADEYAEFMFAYDYDGKSEVLINIASDSNYNLLVNGQMIAFGQYADYPHYKVYDTISLSSCLQKKNTIRIVVWYYGKDTQTYIKDYPGVIFELLENGEPVICSDENTLSRKYELFENNYCKPLTSQLGFSFKYYGNKKCTLPFTDSVIMQKGREFFPRPCEKLLLGDRVDISIINKEGGSYLIDLGKETVGFIDLEFTSSVEQTVKVGYSEHLDKGNVPYEYNGMNFSIEYVCKRGENKYVNYFRRLAGRYLQVFCDTPIELKYAGLLPTDYPLKSVTPSFKSELRRKIYDVAVRTLSCCMHEHYEDCPRREQALYNMDSRNEMLCTYVAFKDYKFARSNLVLMTKGLRKDGLLSICYPAGRDIPIPFFSLIFPVQVLEYVEYSKDVSILDETFETCKTIITTMYEKIADDGLIKNFRYPYWNFYEWSEFSNNGDQISRKPTDFYPEQSDLILNCMYLLSLKYFKKICALYGRTCDIDCSKTEKAIKATFFVQEKGLFKGTDIGKEYYSVLGNALAVLCGLGDEAVMKQLLNSGEVIPITLSMNTFLYEALLSIDKQKYKKFVLDDIDKKYKGMLDQGATTFWETEEGVKGLSHTGSLCHGWSAMPVYYYTLLNGAEYFNGAL